MNKQSTFGQLILSFGCSTKIIRRWGLALAFFLGWTTACTAEEPFDAVKLVARAHNKPVVPTFQKVWKFEPYTRTVFSNLEATLTSKSGDRVVVVEQVLDGKAKPAKPKPMGEPEKTWQYHCWDPAQAKRLFSAPLPKFVDGSARLSDDGHLLLWADSDGRVVLQDTLTGKVVREYDAVENENILGLWFTREQDHILALSDAAVLYRYPFQGTKAIKIVLTGFPGFKRDGPRLAARIVVGRGPRQILAAGLMNINGMDAWRYTHRFDLPTAEEVRIKENPVVEHHQFEYVMMSLTNNYFDYADGLVGTTLESLLFQNFSRTDDDFLASNQKFSIMVRSRNITNLMHVESQDYVAILENSGIMEYQLPETSLPSLALRTPFREHFRKPYRSRILPNGSILLGEEKQLTLIKPDREPAQPCWELMRVTQRALRERDFDRLEQLGAALLKDPEPLPGFIYQSAHETWLLRMCAHRPPSLTEKEFEELLAAWQKALPNSVYPQLIQAYLHYELAWAYINRSNYSDKRERFTNTIAKAAEVMKSITYRDGLPPEYYRLLFSSVQNKGGMIEKYAVQSKVLWEKYPTYAEGHALLAWMLLPGWHGEKGESAEYAKRIADQVGGEAGDRLYAQLSWRLMYQHPGGDFYERTGYDLIRILKGCDAWIAKYPQDPYGAWLGVVSIAWKGESYDDHQEKLDEYFKILGDYQLSYPVDWITHVVIAKQFPRQFRLPNDDRYEVQFCHPLL